ncbi:MAG: hypothetical protein ABR500_02520 [Dermatophilaceae bacterium]|nr:hypothetical protein [Intrasporangiaceae bacterium]
MSVMEKRLQLLLDAHRWDLVSQAAAAGQRSAASVIREAIDVYFGDADADVLRAAAAREFLEMTASPLPGEVAQEPHEMKAEREADAEDWYERVVSR